MKKIHIAAASLLMFAFTSCSGFLDQDNKGNIGQPDYYSTLAGFQSLSNASYSILRTLYGGDPWLTAGGTDLYGSGRTGVNPVAVYSITSSDTDVKTFYTDYYKAISLANDVIYWGKDDQERAQLVAEARGMRAMYYLTLVQQFGGVPLVIERQSGMMANTPRKSAAEIYKFVIDELKDLADNSNLLDKATGANIGHFDKRAAAHFLAKAYLCRGYESFAESNDFANAKTYADKAIGGDKLTTPFADLFTVKGETDNEILFSVQYNLSTVEKPTEGNKQQAHFGAYLDGQEKGHKYTSSTLTPTIRMHEIFAENTSDPSADERYEGTFMTELRASYWDFYDNAKKNSSPVTYYYCPEWLLADTAAWRAELPSRANAIIVEMIPVGNSINNVETTYEAKAKEDVYGVASFRKFDDTDNKGTFSTTASMRDIILARLGETYLIAAEALVKQNLPDQAVTYINEVRGRAKATLATSAEMDIDYILNERARELAGEYHRWMDLKRTGKLLEYVGKWNPDVEQSRLRSEYLLRPIPAAAIELNPSLEGDQNPGY